MKCSVISILVMHSLSFVISNGDRHEENQIKQPILALRGIRHLEDFAALEDTLASLKAFDATAGNNVEVYPTVFDMDNGSHLSAVAVDRAGSQNLGLHPDTGVTDGCRLSNFKDLSNTYHRWDRVAVNGHVYEVHMYELYFVKDVVSDWFGWFEDGHTHDVETVIMIFIDNAPQWVGVSAHGNYGGDRTRHWDSVPKLEDNHPKVVYHQDDGLTHAFRFAKDDETSAENPTGE